MKSIATCLPRSAQNHNYKYSILIAGFPVAQKRADFFGGGWCVETRLHRWLRDRVASSDLRAHFIAVKQK